MDKVPSMEEVRAAYQAFARSPACAVLMRYWQMRFGYMTRSVFVPNNDSATFVNIGKQSAYQIIANDIAAALSGWDERNSSAVEDGSENHA
jgi:hypothetical protein